MSYRLGIDLGTSFTAAAFIDDTGPRMLELGRRQVSVPSVLLVAEDGDLLIGEAAERRAASEPDRVIREVKRRFGDKVPLVVAGHSYTPIELQTEMLRWVLDHAEQRLPPLREHVVVTHPASWGPYKLACMRDMVTAAGAAGATLCAEPVAAAIDFAATREVPEGAKLVIYDLGGGTFDVAVVEKVSSGFRILGTPLGVDHLGGSDFDESLFATTLDRLGVGNLDQDNPDIARGLIALRRECVEAKEALSTDVSTQISSLLPGAVRTVRISRRELEELIRPALDESVSTTSRALRLAGVSVHDLHAVVLVGGSSRIPLVTELLTREFGVPVVLDTYPKNTIALGAARRAALDTPAASVAAVVTTPPAIEKTDDEAASAQTVPEAVPAPPASVPPRTAAEPLPVALAPVPAPAPAPAAAATAAAEAIDPGPPDPAHDSATVTTSDGRHRRWIAPVGVVVAISLVITAILLVTNQKTSYTGSGSLGTAATTSLPVKTPSPTTASPLTATPRPSVPSLPAGRPLPDSVILAPMRFTNDPDERRQLQLIDSTGSHQPVVIKSKTGSLTNPTVQPDRRTILIRRDGELWVMASDGKHGTSLARRYAGGCRSVLGVSWSQVDPNVVVIACQIGETNRQKIQVVDITGKLVRTLDTGKRRAGDDVTISPDGRRVLYWATTSTEGDGGSLYAINVDGTGKPKRLTAGDKGRDGDPAWSPDGRHIAFRRLPGTKTTGSDVYVMNADGSNQRKVGDTKAEDMKPVWSPDGSRVLIVSNRRSAHGAAGTTWGLWLVDVASGQVIGQVGRSAREITTPTWLYR